MKPLFLLKSCICLGICLSVNVYSLASGSESDTASTHVHRLPPLRKTRSAGSAAAVSIPGPLRSFLRMAGISQKISMEEVLPSACPQHGGGRLPGPQG